MQEDEQINVSEQVNCSSPKEISSLEKYFIAGNYYYLNSKSNSAYTKAIVSEVNARYEALLKTQTGLGSRAILILVLLQVLDELQGIKKEFQNIKEENTKEILSVEEHIHSEKNSETLQELETRLQLSDLARHALAKELAQNKKEVQKLQRQNKALKKENHKNQKDFRQAVLDLTERVGLDPIFWPESVAKFCPDIYLKAQENEALQRSQEAQALEKEQQEAKEQTEALEKVLKLQMSFADWLEIKEQLKK